MKPENEVVLVGGTIKVVLAAAFAVAMGLGARCQGQGATDAGRSVVRIADDVCHELIDAGVAPEWVQIACDTADGVITVLMPRREWTSLQARHLDASSLDAGPGK